MPFWNRPERRAGDGFTTSRSRDPDDDSPARQPRLGFDFSGRLLELIVLRFDSSNRFLIHAMKARRQYLDPLH